eukprot:8738996-Alexandrium_andersonii.AAC.1
MARNTGAYINHCTGKRLRYLQAFRKERRLGEPDGRCLFPREVTRTAQGSKLVAAPPRCFQR